MSFKRKRVTGKQVKASVKRHDDAMSQMKNLGDVTRTLQGNEIKAEYDTWSWYYTELSNIRMECRRLGFLVRINNKDSPLYLQAYHAHLNTYLQMITTVLPQAMEDKIFELYYQKEEEIKKYYEDNKLIGVKFKIPDQLIRELDNLQRFASRIAQEVGLGFKVTIEKNKAESLAKRILGE